MLLKAPYYVFSPDLTLVGFAKSESIKFLNVEELLDLLTYYDWSIVLAIDLAKKFEKRSVETYE